MEFPKLSLFSAWKKSACNYVLIYASNFEAPGLEVIKKLQRKSKGKYLLLYKNRH